MTAPVRSLAEVQALAAGQLNVAALNRACDTVGTDCVMVFTFETERPEATVHVRMFAPRLGVPEDPATGSANGALGAYLVHRASTSSALGASTSSALRRAVEVIEPTTHILSEQGAEIDRPSTLYVELALSLVEGVDSAGEEISAVRVGGQIVLVAEGTDVGKIGVQGQLISLCWYRNDPFPSKLCRI